MTESFFQDSVIALVSIWDSVSRLIKIIDINFYILDLLINFLQLIFHLIDIIAEHLIVLVLFSIFPVFFFSGALFGLRLRLL